MSRKNLIYNFKAIDNGSMATAQIVGLQTDVSPFDTITYDIHWSAGAFINGEVIIEHSKDGLTWTTLDFGALIVITPENGSHQLIITEVGFKFLRPTYTKTSVSATGNITISIFCTNKGC